MRDLKLLILILIFGQALLAQKFNGFYIEPNVNQKIFTNNKNNQTLPIVNEYFTITPMRNFYSSSLNLGLNIGYVFKNNNKLQFNISQDESLQGVRTTGTSIGKSIANVTAYDLDRFNSSSGVTYTNFGFLPKSRNKKCNNLILNL